jgi:hypothetical protein
VEPAPRRAGDPIRVFHRDGTIATAEVGQICVAIWRGGVTNIPFEQQRTALAAVVQNHPEGAGFLCVIEKGAEPPDDELRRASSKMVKSHGSVLRCVACVAEGDGFGAAIHRSVLSGILFLIGQKETSISVFARVSDAVPWMRRHVDMGSTDGFVTAVEHVRSQLIRSS